MMTSRLLRSLLKINWCCWHHLPDLKCKLGQVAVECKVVEMKVSISKSEATSMALCSKAVDCSLYSITQ